MGLVKRSLLNLVRSPARTLVIIFMLAISLGLGLTMFEENSAAASQLGAISGKIGTNIFISPAGYQGFTSGNEILDQAEIGKLQNLEHVISVQSSLSVAYSGSSPIRPGNPNGATRIQALSVLGLDPAIPEPSLDPPMMSDAQITVVDGNYFTAADINGDVMVVGQALAEANNLQVGSKVDIKGTPVRVVGIYTTGQINNLIVMPIATVQRLYNLPGANGITVITDDVNNVSTVVQEIRTVFDANTADVLTATEEYYKINANIIGAVSAGRTGMAVSFAAAAAIMLLSVFLVMHQRVREIGIMKAIGASNWQIGFGFSLETLFICLVSAAIGMALSVTIFAQNINGIRQTNTSLAVFLVAVSVTIILGFLASIIPVWYIARVRPAEALRNE